MKDILRDPLDESFKDFRFQLTSQFLPHVLFYLAANTELTDKSQQADPMLDVINVINDFKNPHAKMCL